MRYRHIFPITPILLILSSFEAGAAPTYETEKYATRYQYAVKATCSLLTPFPDGLLVAGTYRTGINIHNPSDQTITITRKVAVGVGEGEEPGEFSVSPFKKATLAPDGTLVMDCGNIAGFFCPFPIEGGAVCIDFGALDGFVVINSPIELDVVAVYTARQATGEVHTLDVEPVPGRRMAKDIKVLRVIGEPKIIRRMKK